MIGLPLSCALSAAVPAAAGVREDIKAAQDSGDFDTAFRLTKPLAEAGEVWAELNIGIFYRDGKGVAKDSAQAVRWLKLASGRSDNQAMANLGAMYEKGETGAPDYDAAVEWYKKSFDHGRATSALLAAVVYDTQLKDPVKALDWYRKAGLGGIGAGALGAGMIYYQGAAGVKKDFREAFRWFKRAADLGSANGVEYVGSMYYDGEGVKADYAEAIKWNKRAADLGQPGAMFSIGKAYEEGKGVDKDMKEALSWYRKAADLGDDDAKARVKALEPANEKKEAPKSMPDASQK